MQTSHASDILDLDASWAYKVSVLADVVARRVSSVLADVTDLNLSQWRVLAAIAEKPGRTASEVVAITPMDKAIVSRAVAMLQGKGYVERQASARDGRLSHLFLTRSGEAEYSKIVVALRRSGADGEQALDEASRTHLIMLIDRAIDAHQGE